MFFFLIINAAVQYYEFQIPVHWVKVVGLMHAHVCG